MAGTPVIAEDADNLDGTGRPELHRSIGPFQMAFYGLGSMLGSVVCGLIGQAAGQVGNAVWLAFLVALLKNRERGATFRPDALIKKEVIGSAPKVDLHFWGRRFSA